MSLTGKELLGQFPPEFTRTFINVPTEVDVQGAEFLLRGPITASLATDFEIGRSEPSFFSKTIDFCATRRVAARLPAIISASSRRARTPPTTGTAS